MLNSELNKKFNVEEHHGYNSALYSWRQVWFISFSCFLYMLFINISYGVLLSHSWKQTVFHWQRCFFHQKWGSGCSRPMKKFSSLSVHLGNTTLLFCCFYKTIHQISAGLVHITPAPFRLFVNFLSACFADENEAFQLYRPQLSWAVESSPLFPACTSQDVKLWLQRNIESLFNVLNNPNTWFCFYDVDWVEKSHLWKESND